MTLKYVHKYITDALNSIYLNRQYFFMLKNSARGPKGFTFFYFMNISIFLFNFLFIKGQKV